MHWEHLGFLTEDLCLPRCCLVSTLSVGCCRQSCTRQTSTPSPRDGSGSDQESSEVQNYSVLWKCCLLLVWSDSETGIVEPQEQKSCEILSLFPSSPLLGSPLQLQRYRASSGVKKSFMLWLLLFPFALTHFSPGFHFLLLSCQIRLSVSFPLLRD